MTIVMLNTINRIDHDKADNHSDDKDILNVLANILNEKEFRSLFGSSGDKQVKRYLENTQSEVSDEDDKDILNELANILNEQEFRSLFGSSGDKQEKLIKWYEKTMKVSFNCENNNVRQVVETVSKEEDTDNIVKKIKLTKNYFHAFIALIDTSLQKLKEKFELDDCKLNRSDLTIDLAGLKLNVELAEDCLNKSLSQIRLRKIDCFTDVNMIQAKNLNLILKDMLKSIDKHCYKVYIQTGDDENQQGIFIAYFENCPDLDSDKDSVFQTVCKYLQFMLGHLEIDAAEYEQFLLSEKWKAFEKENLVDVNNYSFSKGFNKKGQMVMYLSGEKTAISRAKTSIESFLKMNQLTQHSIRINQEDAIFFKHVSVNYLPSLQDIYSVKIEIKETIENEIKVYDLVINESSEDEIKEVKTLVNEELELKKIRQYKAENLPGIKKYFDGKNNALKADLDVISKETNTFIEPILKEEKIAELSNTAKTQKSAAANALEIEFDRDQKPQNNNIGIIGKICCFFKNTNNASNAKEEPPKIVQKNKYSIEFRIIYREEKSFKFDVVKNKIHDLINKKYVIKETLDLDANANITKDEIEKELGGSIGRHYEIDLKKPNRIVFNGAKDEIADAKLKITNLMNKKLKAHYTKIEKQVQISKNVQWQYDFNQSEWKDFSIYLNSLIETNFAANKSHVGFKNEDNLECVVYLNLKPMIYRIGVNDFKIRRLELDKVKKESISVYPNTWTKISSEKDYELVDVAKETREFKEVYEDFAKKMGKKAFSDFKLKRIENKILYRQYKTFEERLIKKGTPTNEKTLFHGTRPDSVENISRFGFDRNFCGVNGVVYGKGVYFAVNSSYSHGYTTQNDRKMFRARVFVGETTLGDESMRKPPNKNNGTGSYDSTCNKDQSIFVAYHDCQCYPEYLIEYKNA